MKNALWLVIGVGFGFLAAHHLNSTSAGRSFFESIDSRSREFMDAVADGYNTRSAELSSSGNHADR